MRFLGAKVVLTPAPARGTGMIAKAEELAERMAGSDAASSRTKPIPTSTPTTAQEILEDFADERLDYWVTASAPAAR